MKEDIKHFEKLYSINANDKVEKKNGLTYLSWAWAWAEVKKLYPSATYNIKKFINDLPYVYDEKTGYMVFTNMTIDGITHEMWLCVMDGSNNAMKDHEYTYQVKKYEWNNQTRKKEFIGNYEEKKVEQATMFDINKTLMRCLTKNIAMFGLGLYIYAGEDLPEGEDVLSLEQSKTPYDFEKENDFPINETTKDRIKDKFTQDEIKNILMGLKKSKLSDLTLKEALKILEKEDKEKEEVFK